MPFTIHFKPSGHSFPAREDDTVYQAATAAGIGVPHNCLRGVCRTCHARVLEGTVAHLHDVLRPEDIAAGSTLLCQAVPRSDVVIEVREVPFIAKTDVMKALVSGMRLAAPDVMILSLRLPPGPGLHYAAGQHLEVLLTDGRRRHYSLATVPNAEGNWKFDLHIRHRPGGHFTDQVFAGMKPRDALTIRGPLGSFFLREDRDKPIILVAGGTGYAPIRSLLGHALVAAPDRDIHLYWGGRSRADLYLAEEAAQWAQQHPRLRFIPVLSAPLPADAWQGRTGLVHHAVMEDFTDLAEVQVYAGGAPTMIDAARDDFVHQHGLPDTEFFADSFLSEAELAAGMAHG